MPTFRLRALLALVCALLGCSRPTRPAEEAHSQPQRRAAGTSAASANLAGRVLFSGPPAASTRLATNASVQSVCGASVIDNALRVDASGGVADAVVWVDAAAEAGEAAAGPPLVLDQRGCLYWPPVLAARAGGMLQIRNSDPLTHTVHAFRGGQTAFNVAMPLEHMQLQRPLPAEPAVVDIRCDVHPWMHAQVRTFDHPHFTTTSPDGRFLLPGLPVGEVQLHVWHPKLGERSAVVRVEAGAAPVDIAFGATP